MKLPERASPAERKMIPRIDNFDNCHAHGEHAESAHHRVSGSHMATAAPLF
jgi:hypothetical protein